MDGYYNSSQRNKHNPKGVDTRHVFQTVSA